MSSEAAVSSAKRYCCLFLCLHFRGLLPELCRILKWFSADNELCGLCCCQQLATRRTVSHGVWHKKPAIDGTIDEMFAHCKCRKAGSDKPVMVRAMATDIVLFGMKLQDDDPASCSSLHLHEVLKAGEGLKGKHRLKAVLSRLRNTAEMHDRVGCLCLPAPACLHLLACTCLPAQCCPLTWSLIPFLAAMLTALMPQ
jgi:hypothetical protein